MCSQSRAVRKLLGDVADPDRAVQKTVHQWLCERQRLGATPHRYCGQALETLQDPQKTAAKSQENSHKNQDNPHKSPNDQQQLLQGLAEPSGFSTVFWNTIETLMKHYFKIGKSLIKPCKSKLLFCGHRCTGPCW